MRKYLFLLMLCFFVFACEQERITPELTTLQNQEIIDRAAPCDLTQVPLYIPPAETAQGGVIDFSAAFPVTESTEYEEANGSNVVIHQLNYRVNNSSVSSSFAYQENADYNLVVDVRYFIDNVEHFETFSLCFGVKGQQELEWGCSNHCERTDSEVGVLESRSLVTSTLILP